MTKKLELETMLGIIENCETQIKIYTEHLEFARKIYKDSKWGKYPIGSWVQTKNLDMYKVYKYEMDFMHCYLTSDYTKTLYEIIEKDIFKSGQFKKTEETK